MHMFLCVHLFSLSLYRILKRCSADGLRAGWPSACLGSENKAGLMESLWLKQNPVGLDYNLSVDLFKIDFSRVLSQVCRSY